MGRIATLAGNDLVYHHYDGLGSVVDLTDPAGDPLAWAEYTPFGATRTAGLASGAPELAFGFTGEFTDPTGLVHLRARQYDPATGRFLSTDPAAPMLTDPYIGTYAYVKNNPAAWTDPSGKFCPMCVVVGAGAIVGGLASGIGSAVAQAGSGEDIDWGQVGLATVAGAASGAACPWNPWACWGVSASTAVAQYVAAPGAESLEGAAAAALIGGVTGRIAMSIPQVPNWAPNLLRETARARAMDAAIRNLTQFPRSAFLTVLGNLAQTQVAYGATGSGGK